MIERVGCLGYHVTPYRNALSIKAGQKSHFSIPQKEKMTSVEINKPEDLISGGYKHQSRRIKEAIEKEGFCGVVIKEGCPVDMETLPNWIAGFEGKKYSAIHGIIKNYGIGQAPFMWKLREWLYPIFCDFWGSTDLLCSMDGACYYDGASSRARGPETWLHRDQRPQNHDFTMIQGVLQIGGSNRGNGGLIVYPRSHTHRFAERESKDWFKIPKELIEPNSLALCCSHEPVVLWLWDSRTWHANLRGHSYSRHAFYVTFGPRSPFGSSFKTDKRIDLIKAGETTSHWPTKLAKNPSPRWYSATEDYIDPDFKGETVKFEDIMHLPFAF